MVLTEKQNYHANYIGAIRTNKENLKKIYNVDINITRHRFGEFQEVNITGYTKDIKNVKKALQCVVEKANVDYQEYLDRRRGRKAKFKFKEPESSDKRTKKPGKKQGNPFAVLEDLEDVEEDSNIYIEEEIICETETNSSSSTYNPNISWADMSDDEE
jgi:uncharacterized protein (DUF2235 family)